jgi:hypothetical protein
LKEEEGKVKVKGERGEKKKKKKKKKGTKTDRLLLLQHDSAFQNKITKLKKVSVNE